MINPSDLKQRLPNGVTASTETKPYAVDGLQPVLVVTPASQEEIASVIIAAASLDAAVVPWGGGTQQNLGLPLKRYDVALDLSRLNRVVEYESADLTVTVESGTRLAELQNTLGERGQWLRLDPPLPPAATIGGILATNASGPARIAHGSARDLLIGISFVTAEGQLVKAGGRVVKNVAGYDLGKLHIGALGSLGVIVQASFRVAPLPAQMRILAASGSISDVMSIVGSLFSTGLSVNGLALTKTAAQSGWTLLARFAGGTAAVERSLRDFSTMSPARPVDVDDDVWREATAVYEAPVVARASVPPASLPGICSAFEAQAAGIVAYPGVGIAYGLWPTQPRADVIEGLRRICVDAGGALVLERAPADLKHGVDVWGNQREDFELMRRLKDTLDPKRTLNPGRYLGGL